ncbi:leader peptidase (prepilin peptidase)/N-methyltransferase [Blastococcus colisei]|uniref:Leader peptidase (Prepilin peptidase)/N-methyltransferase n=1 Tax=Blastococcus colisei TaxID=1564162 RepID=A0A543PGT0_9ACTN|nr:A24 family peptidase [Blastococcus colisei]TQN43286.1 leader peptidase (prepilin peptidase)/N-methyltransferase [Blastococcus colisei]
MEISRPVLLGAALLIAVLLGPWLARVAVRLTTRDHDAVPSLARIGVMTGLVAVLLVGAVELTGLRPATVALGWAAGAAVVLGAVDLASHRLPDRVTYPAAAVCAVALLVDAAVLGTWDAFLRGLLAAVVSFAVGAGAAVLSPDGFGFGDVKLLGLLGLVLGWFGWGVLMTGVFLGLLTGAVVSLLLLATRRAGWRTAIPFGPPLLTGAVLVLTLGAVSLG